MPVNVFYNVFHDHPLGGMIVAYFILSGLACGTFLVSVVSLRGRGQYRKIQNISAYLTPALLAAGFLFLLLDLGKPLRLWHLFVYLNPRSVASWGVCLSNILLIVSLLYAYATFKGDKEKSKKLALVGVPFAVLVSGYSGFILLQMQVYALWHSALIPELFSVSAIASGLALVVLGAILGQVEKGQVRTLGRVLAWVIGFDLLLVLVEVITLFNGHVDAVEGVKLLLAGSYSFLFLGLHVIAGLVVPLFILARKHITLPQEALASALVLVGTMAMRYSIVMSGQYFPQS